jgi:hypothetical protein
MPIEKLKSGLTAGFVATVVLSLLLAAKSSLGMVPALDPTGSILVLGDLITGTKLLASFGWVMHLLIGTFVGGVLYSLVEPLLPGKPTVKGVAFGFIIWMAMVFLVVGVGLQGVIAALVMSLSYGVALGVVYANLDSSAASEDVTPN